MASKDVYLYDDSNNVLQVKGILVELYSRRTGALLDKQFSHDLNPGSGWPSNEWGAKLNYSAPRNDPVDIIITDKKYKYPGNVVGHLYAGGTDRVNIDLLAIPSSSGWQSSPPPSTAGELIRRVEAVPQWSESEKDAVRNLISNYINIFVSRGSSLNNLPGLQEAARNWEAALRRLNINPDILWA